MLLNRKSPAATSSTKLGQAMKLLVAGCAAGTLCLGAQAFMAESAGATPSTMVLHYFQVQTALNFYNAVNVVIHHYPPLGGHVREDDVDYVGDQAHHAATWTVSDHLFCTVVSMPATARCFGQFAIGGALIYADNFTVNLAANDGAIPVDGGTGNFAGYTGSITETSIGNTNDSDLIITLRK